MVALHRLALTRDVRAGAHDICDPRCDGLVEEAHAYPRDAYA